MTNAVLENPWHNLPTEPPYILPEDAELIQSHRNFSNLRLDAVPGQIIGGLDTAEVVFLLLNPGFNENDVTVDIKLPGFIDDNQRNHIDPYNSPFLYFNKGYEVTGGYKWWTRILNPLIQEGITEATLRNKIIAIEYFPYHSKDWKDLPRIPSQQFAFDLVREAINRNKVIIIRSPKRWVEAVPELAEYPYMTFRSQLNVSVSPKNIGEENFNTIKSRIIGE